MVLYFQSPSRVATTEEEEEAPLLRNTLSPEEREREAGSCTRERLQHCSFESIRKRENRRWELMGTYRELMGAYRNIGEFVET